eukprot:SAG31_NODE_804_length_11973_cov_8.406855_6_plen_135_part_00
MLLRTAGFARPHAPWRVPERFWKLYDTENISMPTHRMPPENMPGIAWKQDGFYNATDSSVLLPGILNPLATFATRSMRHAYFAAVSWLDYNIGTVLDGLDSLGLQATTAVVLHGDHGFQLGEHSASSSISCPHK